MKTDFETRFVIEDIINESIKVKEALKSISPVILEAVQVIEKAINNGNKILLCGNGGSAADAQHIACEFIAKLMKRRKSLPAIALTTNTSILTAISNDDSFEEVFSRQIEGIGKKGDVLIAISTSGSSPNILKAVQMAKEIGMKTIGLTGEKGHKLQSVTDICIKVPSSNTQRVQECHITIGHIICEMIERKILNSKC